MHRSGKRRQAEARDREARHTQLDTPGGDDNLTFKGAMTVPTSPAIDPTAKGMRVLIVDATETSVIDATIPGGACDSGTHVGCKVNPAGTSWKYGNPSGFLGITKVSLGTVKTTPGMLKFAVTGKNGSYTFPTGNIPLGATIVVDSPRAMTGQCGQASFPGPPPTPRCGYNSKASTLTCK